ncbi:MAG: NADH-quinone oxidoreductase subunit K [Elusimicrobiaceae bacterium]|jgi:multisubunit Na+/H+ antiporter MnhC subunit
MNAAPSVLWTFAILTALAGLYCLMVSRSIFKLLLSADILIKAALLFASGCALSAPGAGLGKLIAVLCVVEFVFIASGLAMAVRATHIGGTRDMKKADTPATFKELQ